MKKFKLIFFGQGVHAVKTLKMMSCEKSIEIVFCAPRMHDNSFFDGGLLSEACDELGICKIKTNDVNSDKFIANVINQRVDLIVNLGHHQLFQKKLIEAPLFGILNYHPGLLPNGRGSGAVVGEIINGSSEIGRTCHLVDENFDRGLIVNQEKFNIDGHTTLTEVYKMLQEDLDTFIMDSVLRVLSKRVDRDELRRIGFGRYFPKFADGDDFIDWNSTSINIYNKIRARLDERFSVFYTKELEKYLVTKASLSHGIDGYIAVNGQVIDKSENGVLVKTADTAIWINEIFDPKTSRKSVPRFKIGTCFQTINVSDFIKILNALRSQGCDVSD